MNAPKTMLLSNNLTVVSHIYHVQSNKSSKCGSSVSLLLQDHHCRASYSHGVTTFLLLQTFIQQNVEVNHAGRKDFYHAILC